jgi:predicted enzyme related to lactoylglutathione lyase
MKFAYTRLVSEDVPALAGFYERLTGLAPVGDDDYVELRVRGAYLAICSRKAANYMHGGEWKAAENASAILEFEVDDVDAERARVSDFVTDWIQEPKDMPWGNRSMLFRDPDGTPINFFPPPKPAK